VKRLLLDANILVSGLFFTGPESLLLCAHREYPERLVISEDIRDEVKRVIARKFDAMASVAHSALADLDLPVIARDNYASSLASHEVVRDPDDRHVLACAVEAECEALVTGDNDLLALGPVYWGIRIINTRTALALLTGGD